MKWLKSFLRKLSNFHGKKVFDSQQGDADRQGANSLLRFLGKNQFQSLHPPAFSDYIVYGKNLETVCVFVEIRGKNALFWSGRNLQSQPISTYSFPIRELDEETCEIAVKSICADVEYSANRVTLQ